MANEPPVDQEPLLEDASEMDRLHTFFSHKNYSDGSIFSARAAELIDSRPNSTVVILEEAR